MDYEPPSERQASGTPPNPPTRDLVGKPRPRGWRQRLFSHGLSPRRRRAILWLGFPLLCSLLAAVAGVVVAASINRPETEQALENYSHRLVTELRDSSGQVIRTYQTENRILLRAGEIPERLQNAVLAAEDGNFFLHGGIDLRGIARASLKNLRERRKAEGASTITMQLARMLFLTRQKKWKRKVEETLLAVELEKQYSKQQILTFYCNLINEGHGNYGMEAAARDYFNKSAGELSLAEAATLAGIPQRPTYFSVHRRKEAVVERRNWVLSRMLAEGYISRQELEAAAAEPLLLAKPSREAALGPYFAEDVRRYLYETYGRDALYEGGLQVETTLDRDIQRAAEASLREGLLELDRGKGWRGPIEHIESDDLDAHALPSWSEDELIPGEWYQGLVLESGTRTARVKIHAKVFELHRDGFRWTRRAQPKSLLKAGDVAWFTLEPKEDDNGDKLLLKLEQEPELEAAMLVLDSKGGAIRAMIGGWDYERNEYNRATQARRQVGSAFKPFVFGAALENGYTAADTLFDGPAVFPGATEEQGYSPRNYHRRYYGVITLRHALEHSVNVTSVKLQDLVGVDRVVDFAQRSGIRTELHSFPSLSLGTADLVPLELAAAYAAIANQGIYVEPYMLERVVGADGRVLEEHSPRAHKAMEPQVAYILGQMMKGVVDSGTATALAKYDLDLAGKTGTTDAYTDAWFVGFTPRYTILTWVGYDKQRSLGQGMTGAKAALPIWSKFVARGLEEGWLKAGESFPVPPGIVRAEIDPATGLLLKDASQHGLKEAFIEGTEPVLAVDEKRRRIASLAWYLQEPFYIPKEGELMPAQIEDWSQVHDAWQSKDRKNRG